MTYGVLRCIFRCELISTDVGTSMCQPPAQAPPDAIKPGHADDVHGLPVCSFPSDVQFVAQRSFDFVNHRLHHMAKEPDGGLVHETPIDLAIQLKALIEYAQLQNHMQQGGQSRDRGSETVARNLHQTSCSSTA